ncbi:hypothetical protein Enr10x_60450 [Gimesia panareensis]|uniref:Uncharacterized protein n=1 Tax=Gimesia panareensis TaxID=2527978 RepID=A0A517QGK2_9PLAN|nr:hypothetical protein [Gimesia panareensis]QDT30677.1 hypothetical protein Enr10x_60450 [Gimesia panareensis]
MDRRQFNSLLVASFFSSSWWPASSESVEYEELIKQIDAAEGNWDLIVTLDSKTDQNVWMQVVEGMVNFHYPFDDEPRQLLAGKGIDISDFEIVDCWPQKCLVLKHDRSPEAIERLPRLMDRYASQMLEVTLSADQWDISTFLQNG